MKKQIYNYSFDSANGIIKFHTLPVVRLNSLLVITNANDNKTIYNFADPTVGSASLVGPNSVNLSYDTSTMYDDDDLLIFYDVLDVDPPQDEPPTSVIIHPDQLYFPVDLRVDGNDLRTDSPGVIATSLVGPTGDPIDTIKGGVLVNDVNGGDPVIGGSPSDMVRGQRMAGTYREVPFSGTGSAFVTPWIDASAYRSVSVHITNGAATATFQASNDGRNAYNVSLVNAAAVGATIPSVVGVGPGIFAGTLRSRYFRLSVSAVACQGVMTFFTEPMDMNGVPTLPIQGTPTIGSNTNAAGALTVNENMVNQPGVGGSVGNWSAQADISDRRFAPTVTSLPNTYTHLGAGIASAGLVGQYDDVSQPLPNEKSMARVRVSKKRSLLGEVRDGSSFQQEYGAQVTSRQALQIEDIRSGQFGDNPILQTAPGVQGVSLVNEHGDPLLDRNGSLGVHIRSTDVTSETLFGIINCAASGVNLLVKGVPGKRILVTSYLINASSVSVNATYYSGALTAITGSLYLVPNSGASAEAVNGLFRANTGEDLNLNLSAAQQVGGHFSYQLV